MNKVAFWVSLVALILAACSPEYVPTPPTLLPAGTNPPLPTNMPLPTNLPQATRAPVGLSTAQQAAITLLSSTLNLAPDQIRVISSQTVIWPDGCLGVQRMGVMCNNQQVPGFVIIVGSNGKQYEFHTNRDGSEILPAAAEQPADAAQAAAKRYLASALGINIDQITVLGDAEVEWPDSCLGVAQEGIMCAMIVMPGHLVRLQANNLPYEFNTNEDGSEIQPATLALTWKRSGGIAGFCDSLTVYLSGEVSGDNCKANPRNGKLLPAEMAQLATWVVQYGQANLDASDPVGASDRMTRQLSLFGNGNAQPNGQDQKALFNWAQDLHQRLYQ
ncbi:MAG TPA: hypothetical protein VLX61_02520 [Anaerolineales bacterium]|nr:hypothetical protein [Anaerolineales bacterium]